jgi:hypothetical protein
MLDGERFLVVAGIMARRVVTTFGASSLMR